MLPNRLYHQSECRTPEYLSWFEECLALIPNAPLQGIRTWEQWACVEGIDWPHNANILDTGSFFSITPFWLAKRGMVTATDNYEWPEIRKCPGYRQTVNSWESLCATQGIVPMRADVQNLPFAAKQFDVVVSVSTIEHVDDWRAGIKEMMRVGKRVLITTDAIPQGRKYFDYQRFFSFDELHEMAQLMGVTICTDGAFDIMHPEHQSTLAVIRQ